MLPWLEEFAENARVSVDRDSTARCRVELPWKLTKIELSPRLTWEGADLPVSIGFRAPATGTSGVIANQKPPFSPITFWMPPGRVQFTASAKGVAVGELEMEIDAEADDRLQVVLPIGPY
jgi:hypothetical protein